MDRLLHGSHTLALKGESLRRAKAQGLTASRARQQRYRFGPALPTAAA
jgi:hypothetical protein